MKTQEIVVGEDSVTTSIQDETNINDKNIIPNDSIYKLIEKQVGELENFGKQMIVDLKNSFDNFVLFNKMKLSKRQ